MSRFTYSQSMMYEYAVLDQHCMQSNRANGFDLYDLQHVVPLIRKTAQEHARALIWC